MSSLLWKVFCCSFHENVYWVEFPHARNEVALNSWHTRVLCLETAMVVNSYHRESLVFYMEAIEHLKDNVFRPSQLSQETFVGLYVIKRVNNCLYGTFYKYPFSAFYVSPKYWTFCSESQRRFRAFPRTAGWQDRTQGLAKVSWGTRRQK